MELLGTASDDEKENESKESQDFPDYWQRPEIPSGLAQPQTVAPEKDGLDSIMEGIGQLKQKFFEYWSSKGLQRQNVHDSLSPSRGGEASGVGQEEQGSWNLYRAFQEKLHHLRNHFLPEDRSPFWVCGILVLVLCLAIAGFRTNVQHKEHATTVDVELASVPRIGLPDGRYIAYREQGVSLEKAKHTIIVSHGFLSSRIAGIPGVNDSLLEEFKVRLVAYDRPGYGQSDPHPGRDYNTSAHDIANIADALEVEKFWVLGYSIGGPYAWASAKYIPERLAGVIMFAPMGNPYTGNMSKEEVDTSWGLLSLRRKLQYHVARHYPSLLPSFLRRTLINKIDQFQKRTHAILGERDQWLLENETFFNHWKQDLTEALRQNNGHYLAEDVVMLVHDWGFNLEDLRLTYPEPGFFKRLRNFFSPVIQKVHGFEGPIHIWQGTDDVLVPIGFAEYAKRMVPQVNLHILDHEGHFSWFCFCDDCHRQVFETVFGLPERADDDTVTKLDDAIAAEVQPIM